MAGHVKLLTPSLGDEAAPVPATGGPVPDTLEQVRELLYGDALRRHDRRLETAQDEVHALEQRMLKRLEEMQATIDALGRALRQEHGNSVRAIGGSIVDMGRQITAMGEIRDRGAEQKSF